MDVLLNAQLRDGTGKGNARTLRSAGLVPAVIYGPKSEPTPLAVSAKSLEKLLRDLGGESKLIELNIEDSGEQAARQVLIREVQVHPVRRRFLHVDFYEVPLDQPIVVEVLLDVQGEPVGVKKGGSLEIIRRSISLRCLPAEIPERIQVDVTGLDLGDTVHISDLISKVAFEIMDDHALALISVSSPEGDKDEEGSESE